MGRILRPDQGRKYKKGALCAPSDGNRCARVEFSALSRAEGAARGDCQVIRQGLGKVLNEAEKREWPVAVAGVVTVR
ncbi:hypothetical protein, partial [Actinoplanes campanulatus]|uniref:hypothetical protein n=1 Tax=Actinoplanes campanulatus TaxID=113559 RepID=UPI0031D9ECA4